ncbi:S-layer homology domain-containing protein [Pseudomonadota bacterium]
MFKKILMSLAVVLLFSATTTAAYAAADPADILPNNVDLYFTFNTGSSDPISTFVGDALNKGFSEEEVFQSLQDAIANTTMSFAMQMDNLDTGIEERMYATIDIPATEFSTVVDTFEPDFSLDEYNGYTIYTDGVDYHITYIDGLLVLTSHIEDLQTIIDSYVGNSNNNLSDNSHFQDTRDNVADNEIIFMYIAGEFIQDFSEEAYGLGMVSASTAELEELYDAIYSEGFSIGYSDSSYKAYVTVLGNASVLRGLGLNFDEYNFNPALYKLISGENLILYTETYNIAESIDVSLGLLTPEIDSEFQILQDEIAAETGIDIKTEIIDILEERTLIAVHNSGDVVPGITVIAEGVGSNNPVTKIVEALKDSLDEEEALLGTSIYTLTKEAIGGASFQTFVIDLSATDSTLEPGTTLTISLGVESGNFVISTHPDLASIYRVDNKGIFNNPEIESAFPRITEEVSEIFYLSLPATTNWISTIGADDPDIEEIEAALDIFGNIYGKTKSTAGISKGEAIIEVNESQLTQALEGLLAAFEDIATSLPAQNMYCDVSSSDWFYTYVTQLSTMGIVKGYEDGCYRPGNDVTRAEFTKMLLMAHERSAGSFDSSPEIGKEYFSDVDPSAWFEFYVEKAAANDLVNGYLDNTFKPNNTITRAEAVKIMINASSIIQNNGASASDTPFNDVQMGDWWYEAVKGAYSSDIVSGATDITFEPHRNLNRAEAAKIILEYYNLHYPSSMGLITPSDTPATIQ